MHNIAKNIYILFVGLFMLDACAMHTPVAQSGITSQTQLKAAIPATPTEPSDKIAHNQESLFHMVTHLTDIQRIIIAYAYENSWRLRTTLRFNHMNNQQIKPTALCYLPAHKNRLAIGLSTGVLQLYDLDQLQCAASTHANQLGHTAQINSIIPLSDSLLATASDDGQIKFWNSANLPQLICEGTQQGNKLPINALVYNPAKKQLLATDASGITLLNYDAASASGHRIRHDTASSLCVSPDGNYCASGARDSSAKIWDTQSGQLISELPETDEEGGVSSIAWLPDGKTIISAHDCGKVKVTDVSLIAQPKSLMYLDNEDYLVHTAQIHAPKIDQLIVGNFDNTIKVFDLKTGKRAQKLKAHTEKINALALAPDSIYLASSSDDSTVHVWENRGLQLLACLQDTGKNSKQITKA